jgi:hypothetical protein
MAPAVRQAIFASLPTFHRRPGQARLARAAATAATAQISTSTQVHFTPRPNLPHSIQVDTASANRPTAAPRPGNRLRNDGSTRATMAAAIAQTLPAQAKRDTSRGADSPLCASSSRRWNSAMPMARIAVMFSPA